MSVTSLFHIQTLRGTRCGLALALGVLGAAAGAAVPAPAWLPSADGASVVNAAAKQVWDRCVHGQRWNGRACEGDATPLSHGEGVALADARNRDGGSGCRMPTVGELQALAAQIGKKPSLFPSTGVAWRWSGSRIVDTASVNQYNYGNVMQGRSNENAVRVDVLHAWAVDLATGDARKDVTKRTRLPVQLVCTAP